MEDHSLFKVYFELAMIFIIYIFSDIKGDSLPPSISKSVTNLSIGADNKT